ncbi:MAG: endolytic transglycosylase MltG [Tissierellia bacterium]|nr:endolytic transglycosylase MltG [Tissierellia bacterium]
MKFLNKLSDLLFGLLRIIVVLIVLGVLLFIVQSRIKHLYGTTIDPSLAKQNIFQIFTNTLPISKETSKQEEEPVPEPREMVKVEIPSGASVNDIGVILKELGFIVDVNAFVEKTKEMNAYPYFKEGTYQIAKDAKNEEVIQILTAEEREKAKGTFEVTLPGSCTTAQVGDILLAQNLIQSKDAFISEVQNAGMEGKFVPGIHIIHGPIKTSDLIQALCSNENLKSD